MQILGLEVLKLEGYLTDLTSRKVVKPKQRLKSTEIARMRYIHIFTDAQEHTSLLFIQCLMFTSLRTSSQKWTSFSAILEKS